MSSPLSAAALDSGIKMEQISKIANTALDQMTNGRFLQLPRLAITGLLNDFQYAWLRRFKIPYKFEMLDFARNLCNGHNKEVFKATQCKSTKDIRDRFRNRPKSKTKIKKYLGEAEKRHYQNYSPR